MAEKRYYWLKLEENFFQQIEIKKLRKCAGGDTYTIIFLKLQLLSLKTDGLLTFNGIESEFAEELSLHIDEDVTNISFVLSYLKNIGWLKEETANIYSLPNTIENIGSKTSAAQRMAKMRDKQKVLPQESVTMLQECSSVLQNCSTDIDIEKDIELDIEGENEPKGSHSLGDEYKSYGEYGYTKLTDEQYKQFELDFGIEKLEYYIKRCDEQCAEQGHSYNNCYVKLRKWVREDKNKPAQGGSAKSQPVKPKTSYDLDELEQFAMNFDPNNPNNNGGDVHHV